MNIEFSSGIAAGFGFALVFFAAGALLQDIYVKKQINVIELHCPDNTKQIVIPDASKLTL